MLSIDTIEILSYILIFIALFYFFNRNDELPFLLTLFFWATGVNRYNVVISGDGYWTVVNYVGNFFVFNELLALEALNFMLLGTLLLLIFYFIYTRKRIIRTPRDDQNQFKTFILSKEKLIVILFGFFFALSGVMKAALYSVQNKAFGAGYFFLFPLALGGLILLTFLLFRYTSFKKNGTKKIIYGVLLLIAMYLSYNPYTRFNFLSWMVAIGILIVGGANVRKKFRIYALGGATALLIFSIAGLDRRTALEELSYTEAFQQSLVRTITAEDQVMLDGFMMSLQVYPDRLPYNYGMQHIDILMRPIPRAIWPGKPVLHYIFRLGLMGNFMGSVGISPSLYGSFYEEGGFWGIVFFSLLYAYMLHRLFKYAEGFQSDMKYLIKGLVIASMIPLLRGGDIAGIYAFIGMSFWPVFILLYQYEKYLKKIKLQEQITKKKIERKKKRLALMGSDR